MNTHSPTATPRKKVTVPDLARAKAAGTKLVMVTAYDATFATLVDEGGADIILVGDSVGTVVQGVANTIDAEGRIVLPGLFDMHGHVDRWSGALNMSTGVTSVRDMRMVARAKPKALIVGDLPFGSYQVSPQQALESSIRLMKQGAECVKLEGGLTVADQIAAITRVDVPVMGHIGLTPQSYYRMGGHKVQGRNNGYEAGGRERLLDDAHALEQAGACAVVLEGIPLELAAEITEKLSIPTIGIGAGMHCDGQVLVLHDLLGLSERTFTFAKRYADLRTAAIDAIGAYAAEVRTGEWPDDAHSYH